MKLFDSFLRTALVASCALMLSSCEMIRHGDLTTGWTSGTPSGDRMAGSNAEVFYADTPAPAQQKNVSAKARAMDWGVRSSRDRSVTVYPLDGAYDRELTPLPSGRNSSGETIMLTPPGNVRPAAGDPLSYLDPRYNRSFMPPAGEPSRIYFNHGVASLDDAAKQVVGAAAQRGNARMVQVEGHASDRTETDDPVESRLINLKISMDRAYNVTRQLIRDGIPAESIKTTAWGDAHPALSLGGKSAEDASRRVEIYTMLSAYPYLSQ